MNKSNNKLLMFGLGILQIFVIGLGGIAGGVGLVSNPSGANLKFSIELLAGTPFSDFLIPGLVLLILIGPGNLVGGIMSFKRKTHAGEIAIVMGIFLLLWIIVQVWWIGYNHWIQPLYFFFGLVELALGLLLRKSKSS